MLRQGVTLVWRPAAVHASRRRSPAFRVPSVAATGFQKDTMSRQHPVAARRQQRLSLPAALVAVALW